jgi:hypothetical protein
MEKMSTGLCNMLLGGVTGHGDLKAIVDGNFKLMVYSGAVPTTADASLGAAVLLCTVDNAGSAVNLDTAASGGTIAKKPSETWAGVNVATGTASFYRFQKTADDGTSSTTQPRIQGTIGIGGTDMVLGDTTLTSGFTFGINYATQSIQPS